MLGGWNQQLIQTFLPETGFQDIFLISCDAQKAYCAKWSSLRCYSMMPTLSLNVLMALNSWWNSSTLSLLGGRFNDSIRLCNLDNNVKCVWKEKFDLNGTQTPHFRINICCGPRYPLAPQRIDFMAKLAGVYKYAIELLALCLGQIHAACYTAAGLNPAASSFFECLIWG